MTLLSISQVEEVMKDFVEDEAIGDRRQEIVFIGQNMKKEALTAALDSCLFESIPQARLTLSCI